MAPPMPQFPSIDAWQKMDESAQDALIERIAAAQRRRVLVGRTLVGVAAIAVLGLLFLALTWP